MTNADWRALIEAYLDGRLSAEAFMRRFIDGWRQSPDGVPHAIADLQVAVEQFEAGVLEAGEEGAVNDEDMRQSAQRTLGELRDAPLDTSHTFDRERAREEMRRFRVQVSGCAGAGCVVGLIWLGLCVLQIYYVSEWIQEALDWGAWPSAVVGFVLAFVPVIGNVLAYLGATQEGWPSLIAAIVFFAAPAAALLTGWSRWRRFGPRG
ncbi:MAG: hypothetical protein AB7P07_09310 [Hyphomonadaceae bacterium]